MKKKKKYILILSISTCLVFLIAVLLIAFNNNDNVQGVVSKKTQEYFDSLPEDYYGLVDFEKIDNVKIENNQKINISPKIKEKHTFEQYEIKNMEIFTVKIMCYIVFDIKNLSYNGKNLQHMAFIFYDKNGNIVNNVYYIFDNNVRIGQTKHIVIEYLEDVSNVYDYKIETLYK